MAVKEVVRIIKTLPFLGRPRTLERRSARQRSLVTLMLFPALLLLFALVVIPMGYAFYLSLSKPQATAAGFKPVFIGLDNYARMLQDPRFTASVVRTLKFTVMRVGGAFLFGFALALVMNETSGPARVLKRLFLIPWSLSFVVNALIWADMYSASHGVINQILRGLGLISSYRSWLGDQDTVLYALTIADAWKAIPFIALVLLAGLQAIPEDLYEAAKVDGAHVLQRFFHVTLPRLRPVILVALVIQTMWSIKAFTTIWLLTRGGPNDRSMMLNIYAYEQSFRFLNLGYGSALAYAVTLLILALTAAYLAVLRIED